MSDPLVEGENGIVVLRGSGLTRGRNYGPALEHKVDNVTGDFIFTEPGVPHGGHRGLSEPAPTPRGLTNREVFT